MFLVSGPAYTQNSHWGPPKSMLLYHILTLKWETLKSLYINPFKANICNVLFNEKSYFSKRVCWEQWCCFTFFKSLHLLRLFNNRRQLGSHLLLHSILCYIVLIEMCEENLASHRCIIWNILVTSFSGRCGYALILHQNLASGSFLKASCNV